MHQIHIGTSGWHYKHWLGTFYPEGVKASGQFEYYLRHFKTVEINNSFYRLPLKDTFINWRESVPDDFVYSVKASRFITHMKKLKDPHESISQFFDHSLHLGKKLGPILFQLPPRWNLNVQRLAEFLESLPKGLRYVFEFRNPSWYDPQIYQLLRQFNCAFCIYELEGHITPLEVTADFIYVRLHGPGRKYQGSYSEETLREWAERCKLWAESKDVYVYFDNDEEGYSAFNALRLLEIVKHLP